MTNNLKAIFTKFTFPNNKNLFNNKRESSMDLLLVNLVKIVVFLIDFFFHNEVNQSVRLLIKLWKCYQLNSSTIDALAKQAD